MDEEEVRPRCVTASIGVAGEKLVAMASIFSETRTFGRGGSGAVLGSKMIKGFAVRGTKGVDVADRAAFSALVSTNMKGIAEACAQPYNLVGMFSKFGTGSGMSLVQSRGALATRNHVYGSFSGSSSIDGQYYEKNFYTKWVACFGCPVHCGRVHTYRNHDGSQGWGRGPEYETMFSFGSDLENGDPDLLAEVNHLTEVYGVDSLTTGVTIAWAIEMAEKGIIKESSLPMKFGDAQTILGLMRMIGERRGLGDILAKGPQKAAEEIGHGSKAFAMTIKNSGFAAWMPRRMKGVALAFATSMRGACHKRAPIGAEIIGQVDMGSYEGKAAMVKGIQDTVDAIFTLVSCRFHEFITKHDMYPEYIKAACGYAMSMEEFYRLGERIWNLQKLFNLGAGLTRADDTLPERCFTEPVLGETSEGSIIDRKEFEAMLDEYYTVRGWDSQGIPSRETLTKLNISAYAKLVR
jgi:aldehyde:ferredoxin oxidoreductase